MKRSLRTNLMGITSMVALLAPSAHAQTPPKRAVGLEEIVVTAQKRSQRLQDVPIAVTAITQASLIANRITTVEDLTGTAPNVTVRQASGSANLPSFTIRGVTSYGVVPGSEKESSIYLDGVYIGSPYAETFELPDIERIEVLRGPQGTLFGRNATTGAISVVTRDPAGVLGGKQDFTFGNYAQFRTRTTINTPKIGPFSAYFSFVHNERDGDIRNLGAGTVWHYPSGIHEPTTQVSPKTLGAHDGDSYFVALKYQPLDNFTNVYKFDYAKDHYTPAGVGLVAVNPLGLGPAGDGFLGAILGLEAGDYVLNPNARRPEAVNNAFSTPAYERVYGHSLTSTYQVNDSVSVKNIFAYRDAFVYANTQLDGAGGLTLPAAFGGGANFPLELVDVAIQSETRQVSDEVQGNYTSKFLTLTSGFLYYHQNGASGAAKGIANNFVIDTLPNDTIPYGNFSTSYNRSTSVAGYTQAEVHITHQLDLVGGIRITADHKGGDYVSSGPVVDGVVTELTNSRFIYNATRPAYSFGLNYKMTHDVLIYAKYSNSFVSGGSVGAVAFKPEVAKSYEIGGKADFLGGRLRTDIALFNADYSNLQSAQSGVTVGYTDLGTVIVDGGNENARGVELEVSARPIDPVTLSGSVGYTDAHSTKQGPVLAAIYNNNYVPTLLPKWDATMSGEYHTQPVFRGGYLSFRMDANWRTKERTLQYSQISIPGFSVLQYSPESWIVNARVSLDEVAIGSHSLEIAGWVRNLTNNKLPTFPLGLGAFDLSSTYQAARTYGIDVNFTF